MKRKHKNYSRPKRPFDKSRIEEEAEIKKEFGLKNKKEIWKAEAKIKAMREKAKTLVRATPEEKQKLFDKLNHIGLKVTSLAEVLSLDKKDYLARRLQTVLVAKGLANTPKSARQMITHKKVSVDGQIVNIPSYVVTVDIENKLKVKTTQIKGKVSKTVVPEGAADVKIEKSEEEKDFEAAKPAEEAPVEEVVEEVKEEPKGSEEKKEEATEKVEETKEAPEEVKEEKSE